MKNQLLFALFLSIAFLTFSCAKEGPYLNEYGEIDPTNYEKGTETGFVDALPSQLSGYVEIDAYSGDIQDIAVAGRGFKSEDGWGFYFSAADFSLNATSFSLFSDGAGLLQGASQCSENFSIVNPDGSLNGAWGYETIQSTDLNAYDLSVRFVPEQGSEKEVIALESVTDGATSSYIQALETLLPGVAGWEIYDKSHSIAILIVSIDGKYGFTVSAENQTSTEIVKSFVTAEQVNAIRSARESGTTTTTTTTATSTNG